MLHRIRVCIFTLFQRLSKLVTMPSTTSLAPISSPFMHKLSQSQFTMVQPIQSSPRSTEPSSFINKLLASLILTSLLPFHVCSCHCPCHVLPHFSLFNNFSINLNFSVFLVIKLKCENFKQFDKSQFSPFDNKILRE